MKMRKYKLKNELSYHKGYLSSLSHILTELDKLICDSKSYKENYKLYKLRIEILRCILMSKDVIQDYENRIYEDKRIKIIQRIKISHPRRVADKKMGVIQSSEDTND